MQAFGDAIAKIHSGQNKNFTTEITEHTEV